MRRQITYGAERRVPCGDEARRPTTSGIGEFTYQYRAFGVPDLALKRGLGRDLVHRPVRLSSGAGGGSHRSAAEPHGAGEAGALGSYGFRDSLDYTRPEGSGSHARGGHLHGPPCGDGAWWPSPTPSPGGYGSGASMPIPWSGLRSCSSRKRLPRGQVFQRTQRARPEDALPEPEFARPVVRGVCRSRLPPAPGGAPGPGLLSPPW